MFRTLVGADPLHNKFHEGRGLCWSDLVPGGRHADVHCLPSSHPAHVLLAKESHGTQGVVAGALGIQLSPPNHNTPQWIATIRIIVMSYDSYKHVSSVSTP